MSCRVLIVEDEAGMRTIFRRVLAQMPCECQEACDGEAAIDLLRTQTPDLIFLDMMLPGVHGETVMAYIAETPRLAKARVVIVSSSKQYQRIANRYPDVTFLLKPIRPAQIREVVSSLVV